MKVIVKEVNKLPVVVNYDGVYRGDCINLIERGASCGYAYIGNNFSVVVDEQGLAKSLPFNFFLGSAKGLLSVQSVVGTAVFTRHKRIEGDCNEMWDFELSDVTDEDFLFVKWLVSKENQRLLGRQRFTINSLGGV